MIGKANRLSLLDGLMNNYPLIVSRRNTEDKWNLTFDEDEILVEEVGVTGKYSYGGKRMNKRIIKE